MVKKTIQAAAAVNNEPEEVDDFSDENTSITDIHDFTFVNNFNAPITVSVVTDLTQTPQVITIQPKKEGVITGKCFYYIKASSGAHTVAVIPGLSSVPAESVILSSNHKSCDSAKFEIKSSAAKGLVLTHFGI